MGYRIGNEKMNEVMKKLQKEYRIFAPKRVGKFIRYGEVKKVSEIVYQEKSHFSPKEVVFPIMQTLLYFNDHDCKESEVADTRKILLFLRACDINGIRRLDNMFLHNGGEADNFYARLREKVAFCLMECKESFDSCFCVSMGSNVAEDYSVAVRFEEEGVNLCLKETSNDFITEVLAEVLSSEMVESENDFTPKFVTENKKVVNVPNITDRNLVPQIHNLPFWREYDEKCIGCGGCNTVCITCSCFDTTDITYNETSRDGERRRVWSSCMLNDYSTMAGGHNVRGKAGDRMRFKTMHKVYDYKLRFGEENMCVGCGRCDMRCPKEIHFSETIQTLAEEVEQLKKTEGSKDE
jgi:anaerobic sulfite reductase subunit A